MPSHISVAIISTESLWDRTQALLSNSFFSGIDFAVFSHEDPVFINSYEFDQFKNNQWNASLRYILPGLLENLIRLNPDLEERNIDQSFAHPRQLSCGELSVISKHLRAVHRFSESRCDYLLVCEDDVIISEVSIDRLQALVASSGFDYIDLAGGDGILTNQHKIEQLNGWSYERIDTKATRTSCCYLISQRLAPFAIASLSSQIFPVDWSYSHALQTLPESAVIWVDSDAFHHGSCVGNYKSWRLQ